MKAVIYARYSSDNQREESIEGQIRECTAFAEKNNITILRHYIDRAFSAKTDNRPEFQNMIKDSGKRLFDMIIVWKLDRFARNRYDSARYKTALKKNGVKVVSATEVISDGAEGIILESVLEGYAEYYSADLSEKVVRGMTENALKSKYNGGTRPIGYLIDNDQCFQLDPLTAPFVREAFQRYDEGATMTQIRDWLNEQGVKNTRGQKMTYNSVQHLLNNRRYIGEYTYRNIVVPDGIPAIVPQDLFDRVQEKLAKNKKAPARHKAEDDYLLTTKLFCGYCGAYLCGESGTSHTGNVHHYYKCVSVKKKRTECHKKSVRKEWIEDLVVNETMKIVMDDTAIEAIVSMLMDLQDRDNVNLPLYEQQLREVDTAIQNLLNAIQQGILTKSTKGRLEELEATKEELETKIACEKLAKPKVSAEFMTFWLHRFRKLDVRQKSHRKMLIDTFINAIFLYDDKMVITFNYKEGTTTITFDDLKTALADQKTGSDLDCSTAPETRLIEPGFSFVFTQRSAKELLRQLPYHYRCRPGTAGHIAVVMQSQHHGLRAGQQQKIGATRRYKRGSGFGINPISKPWASLLRWGNLKIPLLFQHCGYRVPDSISALLQLNTGLIHQPDLTGFVCHAGHQRNGLTIFEPPFKGKKGCRRQNAVFARLTGFPLWPPLALRSLLPLRPPATATARAGPRAAAPFLPAFLTGLIPSHFSSPLSVSAYAADGSLV